MYVSTATLIMLYVCFRNPLKDVCDILDLINGQLDAQVAKPPRDWNKTGVRLLIGSLVLMVIVAGIHTL